MKWYQHIFGDQTELKPIKRQRKAINKAARADNRQNRAYKNAVNTEYYLKMAYKEYKKTKTEESFKKYNSYVKKSRRSAARLVKSMEILNKRYTKLGNRLGAKGRERLKKMFDDKVFGVGNIHSLVWDRNYKPPIDEDSSKKKKN